MNDSIIASIDAVSSELKKISDQLGQSIESVKSIDTIKYLREIHDLNLRMGKFYTVCHQHFCDIKKHTNSSKIKERETVKKLKDLLSIVDPDSVIPSPPPVSVPKISQIAKKENIGVISINDTRITTPITTHKDMFNIRPMGIKFNKKMNVFVININGSLYSFGSGEIVGYKTMKRNTLFGKHCNKANERCNNAHCTYYHDPIRFPEVKHRTRNIVFKYATNVLLRSIIASEEHFIDYMNNPFIVQDLIQLGGMLILKAERIKNLKFAN